MVEQELRKRIISKYHSVKEFATIADMPYTTLDSILKRGVEKANVLNVIKLCKALDIDVDALSEGNIKEKTFEKKQPALEGELKEQNDIIERFHKLSPDNRSKLSELIDLYLSAQDKKE